MRVPIAKRLLILCDLTQKRYLNNHFFALNYDLPEKQCLVRPAIYGLPDSLPVGMPFFLGGNRISS
jgi:hypothetical protein